MFEKGLNDLENRHLLRVIRDRAGSQGRTIVIEGRELLNFASNDYLGLAADGRLIEAAKQALDAYGAGAGASRLLSGGTALHRELEEKAALFKGTPEAVLFNSGYAANTGTIPVLAGEGDAIFSDENNHASLIDGCRLSKAQVHIYRHSDTGHLESLLKATAARHKLIVTDSVFSMEGDIALLDDLYQLCKRYRTVLYLDDAHGTGVLGSGYGALAHFGLKAGPWVVQMFTLGKALGSQGAVVAAQQDVIQWIINKARSLIYSTSLPASSAAAAITAISIITENSQLINQLWENRAHLIKELSALGLDTGHTETPIVPIFPEGIEQAVALSEHLLENGIYAPAIRPPTVSSARLRISLTAAHTAEDLQRLAAVLTTAG